MQRALMERVWEILLEVENLTSSERARVQGGLTFIRSDVTEMSTQSKAARPNLETLSDLSSLISIRYAHQSDEEAKSVRVAWARNEGDPHHDLEQEGSQVHAHRPQADPARDSQRRHLAREINEIINASTAAASPGESTGLNRRVRWSMEKLAAGSTLPAGGVVAATGNTANAQLAARQTAQAVSASRVPLDYKMNI